MGIHRRRFLHKENSGHPHFWVVYLLSVIFTFQGLIIAYSNSTYLENFITTESISLLYTASSIAAVVLFLYASHLLRHMGNVLFTALIVVLQIIALITIGLSTAAWIVLPAFLILLTLNPLLFFNIDIFSESLIGKDESGTGGKRGLTLGLMSMAAVSAPFTTGYIVGTDDSNLVKTYFISAGMFVLFLLVLFTAFRSFKDATYKNLKIKGAVKKLWTNKNLRFVFSGHLVLQIFFTWMVIYFPLYLATEIGFTWDVIGKIIGVGLLAYVLFEFPTGIIADKFWGEKEMMAIGFVILALASGSIALMAEASVAAWMLLMFLSRIGASLVEVTTESFFFKHTKGSDSNIISLFRLSRPLSGVLGALLGSIALFTLPFSMAFVALGAIMLLGVVFATLLQDTR